MNSCIKSWGNKKDLQRITKIKPFINKYDWEGTNLPSENNDLKKFEKNYQTIAFNAFMQKKKEYILLCFKI